MVLQQSQRFGLDPGEIECILFFEVFPIQRGECPEKSHFGVVGFCKFFRIERLFADLVDPSEQYRRVSPLASIGFEKKMGVRNLSVLIDTTEQEVLLVELVKDGKVPLEARELPVLLK